MVESRGQLRRHTGRRPTILDTEDGCRSRQIFRYDWNRTGVTEGMMFSMPLVAAPAKPPPGMVRVPWSEFFPEWREAEA